MKRLILILLVLQFMISISHKLFSQSLPIKQDFGITVGGFTNFPANQNYLTQGISMFYVAPYIQVGKHEFSAGIVYPLQTNSLYFSDNKINPRPGFIANYKFYVLNAYYRENLFIHYSFQLIRFNGSYDVYDGSGTQPYNWNEKDMYINNVIGLGYNLYFDTEGRFGLYYTLDYMISQTGYKLSSSGYNNNSWNTNYIWNNLSTHIGLVFKFTSLKKKEKK